jgi:hypothetical protein
MNMLLELGIYIDRYYPKPFLLLLKDVFKRRPLFLFQFVEGKMKMLLELGILILSKAFSTLFRKTYPNVVFNFCFSF